MGQPAEPSQQNPPQKNVDPMAILQQMQQSMQQMAEQQLAQQVAIQSLIAQQPPDPVIPTTETESGHVDRQAFRPVASVWAKGEDWTPARRQISDPELYDGEPTTDYRAWRLALLQVAEVDRACFASTKAIICWSFGRTKGRARSLLQAYVEDLIKTVDVAPQSWGKFLEFCDQQFGDAQSQSRKRTAFRRYRQKDTPFTAFYADWIRMLREAGYDRMEDQVKIDWLNEAINQTLWRDTRAVTVLAKTFDDNVRVIGQVADQLEARYTKPYGSGQNQQQRKSGGDGETSFQWSRSSGSGESTRDPDKMDWEPTPRIAVGRRARWVDDKERRRRKDSNLCLRCGSDTHFIPKCPVLPARRPAEKAVNVGAPKPDCVPEEGLEPVEEGKE